MSNKPKETLEQKQNRFKQSALLWAESLYKYELIARAVGIDLETLRNYRKADKEFSDQLEQSRVKFLNRHMKNAKSEFLLERLDPENFKQRTESDIKSDGKGIAPILVKFVDDEPKDNRNTN